MEPSASLSPRKDIKARHESAYINGFIEWHSHAYRSRYRVVGRPDPPDAIVQSGRTTSWIELADVYWNDEWAIDLNSYATPGEPHRPISGIQASPDAQFAGRFVKILGNKLKKTSYRSAFEQHGMGYLVLIMMYPLFGNYTLQLMRQRWSETTYNNTGYFRSVFLAFDRRLDRKFLRWRLTE